MATNIIKSGSRKYSMYNIKYKVVSRGGGRQGAGRYGASLYMKYGSRNWKYMDNVHPSISGTAIYDYARDYAIQEKLIKPRY